MGCGTAVIGLAGGLKHIFLAGFAQQAVKILSCVAERIVGGCIERPGESDVQQPAVAILVIEASAISVTASVTTASSVLSFDCRSSAASALAGGIPPDHRCTASWMNGCSQRSGRQPETGFSLWCTSGRRVHRCLPRAVIGFGRTSGSLGTTAGELAARVSAHRHPAPVPAPRSGTDRPQLARNTLDLFIRKRPRLELAAERLIAPHRRRCELQFDVFEEQLARLIA